MSDASNPSDRFYWKDWETAEVISCSLAAQGLWMRMLCLAAKATRRGYVQIGSTPCTAQDLARVVGESKETVDALLAELALKGVYSTTRDGAIYNRRMVQQEKQRKASAKGGSKGGVTSRDNKKGIFSTPDPTPRGTSEDTPLPYTLYPLPTKTPPNPQAGSGDPARVFDEWYKAYPRKVGRGQAEKAYATALKHAPPDLLLAAAVRYAELKAGSDPRYVKHPATWLNGKCWLDEELGLDRPSPDRPAPPGISPPPRRDDAEASQWRVRLKGLKAKGFWMANHWGPKPGEPGCRVPQDILDEEGF
jgi:hypothetical protein